MSADGADQREQAMLAEVVKQVWNSVVGQVNRLLEAHNKFGYFQFKESLDPSLEDVIAGFEYVDFALEKLLDSGKLHYDEARDALNSKQCILKMRQLAAACSSSQQDDYHRIIQELKDQSKF